MAKPFDNAVDAISAIRSVSSLQHTLHSRARALEAEAQILRQVADSLAELDDWRSIARLMGMDVKGGS